MANESTIVNKNTVLRALGWGAYDETGAQSRFLRQVDLRFNMTYQKDCKCSSYYELFTMVGTKGQDPCSGDSGGFRNIYELKPWGNESLRKFGDDREAIDLFD